MQRNLNPPLGVEGTRGLVIREPKSGIFFYNGNFDLVFQREEEFHLDTTAQLIRLQNPIQKGFPEVEEMFVKFDLTIKARNDATEAKKDVKDNLDGLGQHVCGNTLTILLPFEEEQAELKLFSKLGSPLILSAGLYKFACKLDTSSSLLVQRNQQYERLEKFLIPLKIINKATNQCSEYIGEGGYGKVYKGKLTGFWENRTTAIKFLNLKGEDMILVYEYAANGSLDKHLEKREKMRHITWEQRLKICLGIARGVDYLHSGREEENRVIHRFKECTKFYTDPNYIVSGILTKEYDVYLLGVVMFEMLIGMPAHYERRIGGEKRQPLMNLVGRYYNDGFDKLIDPHIENHAYNPSVNIFKEIAHLCININTEKRPRMNTIIEKIEEALKAQELHSDLIDCVTKDKGFILGKPIAAFTIYQSLLRGNCFDAEIASLSSWLIQKIDKQIKKEDDIDYTLYWSSNGLVLLYFIQASLKPDDMHSVGFLFSQNLILYVEKLYGIICENFKTKLKSLLNLHSSTKI
ncbi:probable receptor-like protein kinase [Tanacetum coccineum]